MQIKSKIILYFLIIFFSSNLILKADEFNIFAKEITFDKNNNVVTGKGQVEVTDKDGKIIKSDKVVYKKENEFLTVEGNVEFFDTLGNILKTNKATYDKKMEIVNTYKNSVLKIEDGYTITSKDIVYNIKDKILSSDGNAILIDPDKNETSVSMFQYNLKKKLFSSVGDIKIVDINKNKYFFKELHINTKEKEMIGSDVSVLLDPKSFGVKETNDPRFVANDIFVSKNKSILSKGVFTVCPIKKDQCPPWLLKAKKITHDKIKKTIYYDHATLKFYDIPLFYFPKFFHPDPTVKRQSGFLSPIFTNSTSIGSGFGLPYYWAISNDRDFTFAPKIYRNENPLFLSEYRQAFKNGFLILDTSFTDGYKKTNSTKTDGSRNHIFSEIDFNFNDDDTYLSHLSLKVQKTSNDTYFRIHDIDTALVDSSNTDLKNEINYSYEKDDIFFNISAAVYENLSDKTNSRYEYITPNILFGKSFFTEKFGTVTFKTNALYKNYEVDKHISSVTNDVVWNSNSFITSGGFVNSIQSVFKNTNYEAKNTTDHKTKSVINEFSGVLSYKSSLPMKKEKDYSSNIFSPTFMVRYAPGHMRNLSGDDINLKYANLYSVNKTSVIEDGISAILGFDYKINKKESDGNEKEKFSLSLGQVFNIEENKDLPSKSSLDQKTSDIVGEIKYNFSKIGSIDYKFSVDHNLGELNYNEISSGLNLGKIKFNLNYLEEQNHVGDEHYVKAGVDLNLNENNKLSFNTRKNFKTESTELYDISYQYMMDCLSAGLVFRREFYEDSDIEAKDTLMFTIKFVPLGGIIAPAYNP
tara:strand:+ start:545 stop:2965 length:2421 start_codon:yes stop_codon:yes gene_type:complete